MTNKVDIYISGQAEPNPGPGAWAAALYSTDRQRIISGRLAHITNQRAELWAAVEAIRALKQPCSVTLYSCNQWFVRVAEGTWSMKNHLDLWEELDHLIGDRYSVQYRWLRKNENRKLADIRFYAMRLLKTEPETDF